jgi:LacI family transcriptional regulator
MAAAGLEVRPGDVLEGDFMETRGHAAAVEMLTRPARPTAIFASSDMAAFGVMRAAEDLGIEVPGGLSVVGFDDIPEAARVNPALTTVRQPLREMGRVAVNQLLARLDDPGQEPARVVLDTELIVRGTTAPPAP